MLHPVYHRYKKLLVLYRIFSCDPLPCPLGHGSVNNFYRNKRIKKEKNSFECGRSVEAYKALVPLSKLKGLMDEQDIQDVKKTKCDKCANCPMCRLSARAKTRSLQEQFEQDLIAKSVTVDFEKKKVFVDLSFIRPPAEFLSRKHGRSDNYNQAL
jgi:hypothetical protein